MATMSDVVRRIQIQASQTGVDQTSASLLKLAGAQNEVAVASTTTDRATLSASSKLASLQRSVDTAYRSEQQLAAAEKTLTTARNQGIISMTEEQRLLGLASTKYKEAGESAVLMGEGLKVAGEAAHGLLLALGPIAVIAELAELPSKIEDTVHAVAGLQSTADTIGITAENLQKLDYAAKLSDVSTDTLNSALERFSKNLGQAETGTGALAKILKESHITISGDLTKDFENYMSLLARTTNQEAKNYLSTTAFGKSAEELGRLANIGADGFVRLGAEAENTGQILDGRVIQSAEEMNEQLVKVQGTLGTAFQQFLVAIAPALELALSGVATGVQQISASLDEMQHKLSDQSTFTIRGKIAALQDSLLAPGGSFNPAESGGINPADAQKQIAALTAELTNRAAVNGTPGLDASGAADFYSSFPQFKGSKPADFDLKAAAAADAKATAAAKAAADAKAEQQRAITSVTNSLNLQTAALTETDKQAYIDQELSQAKVTASTKEGQSIEKLAATYYDQKKAIEAANQAEAFFAQTTTDNFTQMVEGSESVADGFLNIAKAIGEAVIQAELLGSGPLAGFLGTSPATSGQTGGILGAIFSALVPGAGSTGGGELGGFGSSYAKGGVVSGPGISAYSGQIVSGPTIVPYATGGALIGEAGPEAILPLRRGANGALGVVANQNATPSIVINQTINIQGSSGDAEKDQALAAKVGKAAADATRNIVRQELGRQMGAGGMLSNVPK